jgi:hypothetical protein
MFIMTFVELALYGIRQFKKVTKFTFKPGLNLIVGGNDAGKTTIVDCLSVLLFGGGDPKAAAALTPSDPALPCQAGLIFKTEDGSIYRLIRDFHKGKGMLSRLGPDKKFVPMEQEDTAITEFLNRQMGGLDPELIRSLFILGSDHAAPPKSRQTPHDGPAVRVAPASLAPAVGPLSDTQREKKEKRLSELKEQLALADRLAKMEDRLSDLQGKAADLFRRMKIAREKSQEWAQISKPPPGGEALQRLPEDLDAMIQDYTAKESARGEAERDHEEKAILLKTEMEMIPQEVLFKNLWLLIGAGLTVMDILVALFVPLEGVFQHLFLAVLLAGIGMIGFAGVQDLRRQGSRRRLEEAIRKLDQERLQIQSKFEAETARMQELLKRTGCIGVEDLRTKQRNYEQWIYTKRAAEEELAETLKGTSLAEIEEQHKAVTAQIRETEAEIRSSPGIEADLYTLQNEARELERELSGEPTSPPVPESTSPTVTTTLAAEMEFGETVAEIPSAPLPVAGPDFLPEPIRSRYPVLMPLVTEDGRRRIEETASRAMDRLTQGRFRKVAMPPDLIPTVFESDGKAADSSRLSSGTRDQLFFSWWLGVIEAVGEPCGLPLLLDDPFLSYDTYRLQLLFDLLKDQARRRQILLLSIHRIGPPEANVIMIS